MRFHREGYTSLVAFSTSALLSTVALFWLPGEWVVAVVAALSWFMVIFTLFFFRDPERQSSAPVNAVISPADGRVVEIFDLEEEEFFKEKVKKVGIFMSPANVHVNRAPISGRVTFFKYQKGKFLKADLERAAIENEQAIVGLEQGDVKIMFKQIAGFVARRVCCELREGHKVERGERIGVIKFGSRVDVYMPSSINLKVELNQKVRAGETILGEL